jgi:hypothetical protein
MVYAELLETGNGKDILRNWEKALVKWWQSGNRRKTKDQNARYREKRLQNHKKADTETS